MREIRFKVTIKSSNEQGIIPKVRDKSDKLIVKDFPETF